MVLQHSRRRLVTTLRSTVSPQIELDDLHFFLALARAGRSAKQTPCQRSDNPTQVVRCAQLQLASAPVAKALVQ